MKKLIPFHKAVKISVIIMVAVTLFNLLVIVGVFPYSMVWGGRLQSKEEMVVFELISIATNVLCVVLILGKSKWLLSSYYKLFNVLIWLLPVLNLLGIMGNMASTSNIERALFVPVTIVMFVLTLRIALEKNQ